LACAIAAAPATNIPASSIPLTARVLFLHVPAIRNPDIILSISFPNIFSCISFIIQDITSGAHLPCPLYRIYQQNRFVRQWKKPLGASRARLAGRTYMGDLFQPWHLAILAIIVIVLFGGKKLPELGKGLGEGLRGFKEGMKGVTDEMNKPTETTHAVTPKPEESVK
jgi:sec-independent protein translocase protein TatA